jgi:apolipoprotein N-acyltransferase
MAMGSFPFTHIYSAGIFSSSALACVILTYSQHEVGILGGLVTASLYVPYHLGFITWILVQFLSDYPDFAYVAIIMAVINIALGAGCIRLAYKYRSDVRLQHVSKTVVDV